ncbi:hypothetical protein SLS61_002319 [Didymella pomorum]
MEAVANMTDDRDCSIKVPPEVHRCSSLDASAVAVLWSHLKTNLIESEDRKLNALIDSVAADGVLQNMKGLEVICPNHETMVTQDCAKIKSNLLNLLAALPRDSLLYFSSDIFKLDRNVWGL